MSDTTPAAPQAQQPTDQGTEQGKPAEDALGDAGKKALDAMKAERNKAAREAADLRSKLQEFEDRNKTEAERLAEKASTSESRASEAEARATRLEVILDKLPADATVDDVKRLVTLSKRLVGSTREELEADADELLGTFKTSGPSRPSGDIGQGPRPVAGPADGSPRSLIAAGLAATTTKK